MYCQKCGSEIPAGEARCPCCGALRDGLKFCQHCGDAIDKECIVCPKCGKQVSDLKGTQPQVVINNANNNTNVNRNTAYSYSRRPGAEKISGWRFFCACFSVFLVPISSTKEKLEWASFTSLPLVCLVSV